LNFPGLSYLIINELTAAVASRGPRCDMKKYLFLAIAIFSGMIGFFTHGKFEGYGKGLAGVFLILFLIFTLFGKQPFDETGSEHM
jgi:hypothetical protein